MKQHNQPRKSMASSQITPHSGDLNVQDQQHSLFADRLFLRLKWPLFQPLSNTKVLDFDEAGEPHWTPLFGAAPGQHHAIVSEPVTDPPRTRMTVVLDPVDTWEYWQDADIFDQRPAPLTLENKDGGAVTLGQFVTEVHAYIAALRDLLLEAMATDTDNDIQYYFSGCQGPTRSDAAEENEPQFGVFLVDSQMTNMDEWWENVVGWVREG
ncbi:hypothetical protein F4677DRAFT_465307 [Hypoxylon crocopeplum]|nr:hypothetical protein F4677DRAFT_465307 [Hypoxylon crocopeplum]